MLSALTKCQSDGRLVTGISFIGTQVVIRQKKIHWNHQYVLNIPEKIPKNESFSNV